MILYIILLMKKVMQGIAEVLLVMFLLFSNVLMGFYIVDIKHKYSLKEKIFQIVTWENVIIALIAGTVSYFVIQKIRKENIIVIHKIKE
jgi:hypothetical protein